MRRSTTIIIAFLISALFGIASHAWQARSAPAGLPPGTDGSADSLPQVATKVIADDGSQVKFVQATSDGLREVTITWKRGVAPQPSDDDREVTLAGGRRLRIQRLTIGLEPSRIGYRMSFDFAVPADSVPVPAFASRPQPEDPLLAVALRTISETLSATLMAADGDSFSGSFTDVRTHLSGQPRQGADIRREARRAMTPTDDDVIPRQPGGYCAAFEMRQAKEWVRKMNEVNRQLSELGEGWLQQGALNAQPEYRELVARRDALMAEDAAARRRMRIDENRGKRLGRYSTEGVSAAVEKMMIDAETRAFKERLAALRRCHQNPTNPLAQKAKNEDPAFKKVEDALDAIEMEVNGLSKVREGASSVSAAAGVALGSAGGGMGGIMTGILGQTQDAILKQLIEEALASIEKCIVKCDPCKVNPPPENTTRNDTAGPSAADTMGDSGGNDLNYTPGPDQLFTPGPARPQQPTPDPPGSRQASSAVCKPPTHADVTFRAYSAQSGCGKFGGLMLCGSGVEETTWAGGVDLRYVPDDEGWEGHGTISYRWYRDARIEGTAYCPAGETTTSVAAGRPSLVIRVQPTIDQSVTGGNDTSAMSADTSVVEVIAGSGPNDRLDEETQAQSCGQDKSRSGSYTGPGTECHFYIPPPYIAGVYTMDHGSGVCTLSIY